MSVYSPEEDLKANNILCKICKNVFNQPVLLPCSENICSSHLKDFTKSDSKSEENYFDCVFCFERHFLEKNNCNFVLNSSLIYFCSILTDDYSNLYKLNKSYLTELKDSFDDIDLFKIKLENDLGEYFVELKNKVDIRREKMIEEIHKSSDELLENIKKYEKKHLDQLVTHLNESFNFEKLKNELNLYELHLNEYKIDLNLWNELNKEIKLNLDNLKLFKENSYKIFLSNKRVKYVYDDFDSNNNMNLLGKIVDENRKQKVISGSLDKTIKIWNFDTGECLKTFNGHSDGIFCLQLAKNNKIISGSADKTVKIWNIETGECLNTLNGHAGCIRVMKLTKSNEYIITGSWDKTIKIWNFETGQCLKTLCGHTEGVDALELNSDDSKIISGSFDNTIKVWALSSGELVKTLTGHTDNIWVLTWIDTKLVSGSKDETIKIWNIDSGECLKTIVGHKSFVCSLKALSNQMLASGSENGEMKIWNIDSGECLKTLREHKSCVPFLELANDETMLSGSRDNFIKIWNIKDGNCIKTLDGHTSDVYALIPI